MRKQTAKRMLAGFFASVLLLCAFAPCSAVFAEEQEKEQDKRYEIAVAFDNSGSMYREWTANSTYEPIKRWSHAKYAMEIFASMLDYGAGDKLTVFPMWRVTTDGSTPSADAVPISGSASPVSISSVADIDKLHYMYTPSASETPFDCVTAAGRYLSESKDSKKWLVVLTDGSFNEMNGNAYQTLELGLVRSRLLAQCADDVNVYFLTLDAKSRIDGDPSRGFYTDYAATSEQLQSKLVDVCNLIFQRDELPAEKLAGGALTLDISMKSLIVFAQGDGAQIGALTTADGTVVPKTTDSGRRTYSDARYSYCPVAREPAAITDTTLFGQVAGFGACSAGTYKLDLAGASNVQIFYEPNVKLVVEMLDAQGNPVVFGDEPVNAGDYTFQAKLVDGMSGEDLTKHPLLGKTSIEMTIDDGKSKKEIENGGTLSLKPGDKLTASVVGTYLEDYRITSGEDGSFPSEIVVNALAVDATVEQAGGWYSRIFSDSWKPIRVSLSYEGEPLTAEEFAATTLHFSIRKGEKDVEIPYTYELLPEQSQVLLWLGAEDEEGKRVLPERGDYTLTVTAAFTERVVHTANDTETFKVRFLPLWLIWLIALIILALIIWALGIPVRPNSIRVEGDAFFNDNGFFLFGLGIGGLKSIEVEQNNGTMLFSAEILPAKGWSLKKNNIIARLFGKEMKCRLINISDYVPAPLDLPRGAAGIRELKIARDEIKEEMKEDVNIGCDDTITWRRRDADERNFVNQSATIDVNT